MKIYIILFLFFGTGCFTFPLPQSYNSNGRQVLQGRHNVPASPAVTQAYVANNNEKQYQDLALAGPLYLQQIQAAQQQQAIQDRGPVTQSRVVFVPANGQQRPVKYVRPFDGANQQAYARQPQRNEEPEDFDPNPSYQFGFDVTDDLHTNYQNRKEERQGNKITGSYSVVDSDGYIRTVTYTADPKEGFKADVKRQPTDIVVKIPKPDPHYLQNTAQVPARQQLQQQQQQDKEEKETRNVSIGLDSLQQNVQQDTISETHESVEYKPKGFPRVSF